MAARESVSVAFEDLRPDTATAIRNPLMFSITKPPFGRVRYASTVGKRPEIPTRTVVTEAERGIGNQPHSSTHIWQCSSDGVLPEKLWQAEHRCQS